MRIFLGYSTKNKRLAGKIKLALGEYGFMIFLAHEDINPSVEWIDKIVREMKRCHIFIPVLTNNFRKSKWTDQEAGMAHISKKIVVPLKIHINPYGFISRYQAFSFNPRTVTKSCKKLVLSLAQRPKIGNKIRDLLIKKFGNSNSYDNAAINAMTLLRLKKYSKRQINQVIKFALENRQIYASRTALPRVHDFFRQHKKFVGNRLAKKFRALMRN